MENLINSENKLKILTGGGVYRNKKLQMGSTLLLCKDRTSFMKDASEYRGIHLLQEYLPSIHYPIAILNYAPTH